MIKTLKQNKFNVIDASTLDCIHLRIDDPSTAQKLINKTFTDMIVVQNDGLHLHCEKLSPLKMNTILSTLIKAEIFPLSFSSPHFEGYTFSVEGMSCGGCVKKISKALKESFGEKILNVFVSLEMKKCMVIVRDRRATKEDLKDKIQELGYECVDPETCEKEDSCCKDDSCCKSKSCCETGKCSAKKIDSCEKTNVCNDSCCGGKSDKVVELLSIKVANSKEDLKSLVLVVEGMTCTSCATKLEKTVSSLNGVHGCSVNFLSKKCEVVYEENGINVEKIIKSVKQLGFSAEVFENYDDGKVQLIIDEIKQDRKLVESKLHKHVEILQYEIDERQGSVTIEFDASATYKRAIIDKLEKDGLHVTLKQNDSLSMLKASLLGGDEQRKYRNYFLFCLGNSIVFEFTL